MFKPFFVHCHTGGKLPNRNPRGFTLYVQPHDDPRMVKVSGAWCSPKDQFVKKEGRSFAMAADVEVINKRLLPGLLSAMENNVQGKRHTTEADWYYMYKYIV